MNKSSGIDASKEESQQNAEQRRKSGEFVRGVSKFRSRIGDADFPPEPGRYHLFVALNCPWCHRVTLARNILGLGPYISMDVAFPSRTGEDDPIEPNRWEFNPKRVASLTGETLPECTYETATGQQFRLATQIYAEEGSSEASVPILYDKKIKRIINNESSEIIRILNENAVSLKGSVNENEAYDLYPKGEEFQQLRNEIDALNQDIYTFINNGAYKAGFSSDQKIYETAYQSYFEMLSKLEDRLAGDGRPFLTGDKFTEADLRLYPTLFRHDPVYYVRMKLNGAKILDYPNLWRWLCRVYAIKGVPESNSLIHCRQGYFGRSWNNVVPLGPFQPMSYPEAYEHPELADNR